VNNRSDTCFKAGTKEDQENNISMPIFHFHWPTPNTLPYSFFYLSFSSFIHSFIPLACAECDNSLPFSGASSIPLCYVLFPATVLCQLFFHPPSPHLAIYFLVYLSILLFPNSYIVLFWEFYFLPFSVHAQTIVICFTLLFLF